MKNLILNKRIYEKHIKQLKNLSVPNKKLLICFSGIPGSGKTFISKILEERYNGVRIRTDDIREIIHNLLKKETEENPENLDYTNPFVEEYLSWFFKNYSFANKLIILDRSIDRKYSEVFSFSKKGGYQVFIIRITASRRIIEKRIFEKNNCRDPHFDSEIERWIKEWKEFGKNVKSNVVIKNEDELNLESLFLKLSQLIK